MPFGLCNAAQTFQGSTHNNTRDLDFLHIYIDGLLITSLKVGEHAQKLALIFHDRSDD